MGRGEWWQGRMATPWNGKWCGRGHWIQLIDWSRESPELNICKIFHGCYYLLCQLKLLSPCIPDSSSFSFPCFLPVPMKKGVKAYHCQWGRAWQTRAWEHGGMMRTSWELLPHSTHPVLLKQDSSEEEGGMERWKELSRRHTSYFRNFQTSSDLNPHLLIEPP